MNELINKIKNLAEYLHPETVSHYRYLHKHPELSYQEKNTAAYIESVLRELKISFRRNIGGYGIFAWIEGVEPDSGTIALRADMDALPVREANNVDYKSCNEGIMHACGHDSHMASLLTVIKIINNLRENLRGRILFIFQPGEEKDPGGAKLMLADGIFDVYQPDIIVAQHASVDYPAGTVAFGEGYIMASADEIHIRIKGKGGHGAIPHQVNDTVLAGAQLIVNMQQVVSRRSSPFKPCVLSFGRIIADGATNIIPDEVLIDGTFRCMDESERKKLRENIREIALHTSQAYGCECEIRIDEGYPATFNDEKVTSCMREFAIEYLDKSNVLHMPEKMTAEDFGFFTKHYPCTYYRFGVKGMQNTTGLHTPGFLIDEDALKTSVGCMAYLALRYCSLRNK